ncbi:MAG: hypothetical protein P8176_12475 [Gammaproteobacteria bacterium]
MLWHTPFWPHRNWITLRTLMALISAMFTPLSIADITTTPQQNKTINFDFAISSENHTGHFDWSIASDITGTRSPNVLSELTYDNLDISDLNYQTAMRWKLSDTLTGLIELNVMQGTVNTGQVLDADFIGNDKTKTKSLSQSNPSGSDLHAIALAFGLQRYLRPSTHLAFMVGAQEHSQDFIKRNGLQMITAGNSGIPAVGTTFTQLNSSYKTNWTSGFVGTRLTQFFGRRQLEWRLDYHRAAYYAEADWNLRSSFQHPKSFEHLANGHGILSTLTYRHPLFDHVFLTLSIRHENWQTKDGMDRLFFANGNTSTTRLIETNWSRRGYGLGLVYRGGQ